MAPLPVFKGSNLIYFQFLFFYINTKSRKNGRVLNFYVSSLQSQTVSHKLLISLTSVLYDMKRIRKIFTLSSFSFSIFCVKDIFLVLFSPFFPFILVIFLLFSLGMFAYFFFPAQREKDNGKDLQLLLLFFFSVLGFFVLLTMKVSGLLQLKLQTLIILNHSNLEAEIQMNFAHLHVNANRIDSAHCNEHGCLSLCK